MKTGRSARMFLATVLAIPAIAGYAQEPSTAGDETSVSPAFVVYKNPQCGCCNKWTEYMKNAGFALKTQELADLSGIKHEFGIRPSQQSCHTAVWGSGEKRYVFEGHIPPPIIQRFLDAPPVDARGLLVPGMPVGSPGMEYGAERMPYDVLLLKNDGSTTVYARVE